MWKARKIEAIMRRFQPAQFEHMLDIGCGSAHLAAYFADDSDLVKRVSAVDKTDQRETASEIEFRLVKSTRLPFSDATFDFVISNHVIEHVGTGAEQGRHLEEAWRTLKPGGFLYLAVPNKFSLLEPHYRLPLLSWLPLSIANLYMRLTGRRRDYDCRPLTAGQIDRLLCDAGFERYHDVAKDALFDMLEIERGWRLRESRLASVVSVAFALLHPFVPTLIRVAQKGVRVRPAESAGLKGRKEEGRVKR